MGRGDDEDDDEYENAEQVLFQGPMFGREANLKQNPRLVKAALVQVKRMVSDGLARRAHTILLEPSQGRIVIRFVVDGIPYPAGALPGQRGIAMIQMVKVLAGLNPQERAAPQSGGMNAEFDGTRYELYTDFVPLKPGVERKLDEIAAAQKQTETTLVKFTSRRDVPQSEEKPALPVQSKEPPAKGQPVLALGTPAEEFARQQISVADFIKAANFPETAEDKDGFRALRLALEDREAAKLIRSAQDILTLLSQEGIYTDDLRPDMARPEVWRQFAQGTRGREVAALGGVHDKDLLALTADRMKQDPLFRDAAHHFLRLFDRMFAVFEAHADDAEISALGDTRTARAFMLLGRVAGTFD